MSNQCISTLKIEIGRHTLDRLKDLLGPDMEISDSFLVKPFSDSELISVVSDMVTGQYGHIPQWNFASGIHADYYLPTEGGLLDHRYGFANKNTLADNLMGAHPREIFGFFKQYEGRTDFNQEFTTEVNDVLTGGTIKDISEPYNKLGYISWTFETFGEPPTGLFNRLLEHLPCETMGIAWLNHDNNDGGYLAYKDGMKISDNRHGDFFRPELDIAMFRGITQEDMDVHFHGYAYWSQNEMPDCIEGEGEDSTVSKYILDHILEHQACIDNFSDETKLDLALCYFVLRNAYDLEEEDGAMLNDRDALINRLLDDYATKNTDFNKDVLMIFLNEFASEMTIIDILEKISVSISHGPAAIELTDVGELRV